MGLYSCIHVFRVYRATETPNGTERIGKKNPITR